MKRIAVVVVTLCVLIALLAGGSLLLSRAQAVPLELTSADLQVCGGKLCFRGIAAGTTTQAEIEQRFGDLISNNPTYSNSGYSSTSDDRVTIQDENKQITIRFVDNKVATVDVFDYQRRNFPSLMEFVQKYGEPCGVLMTRDPKDIVLVYPSMQVRAVTSSRRLGIDAEVEALTLSDPKTANICNLKINSDYISLVPWLGFTTLDHYRAHGLTLQDDEFGNIP
jgi:hypothetical protein